jgi:hypothetical protein
MEYGLFTAMEKVASHKTLAYEGRTTPTNADSTIKARLIGDSNLIWQKWADCHNILGSLDRTGLYCSFCDLRY